MTNSLLTQLNGLYSQESETGIDSTPTNFKTKCYSWVKESVQNPIDFD